jgi:peptidoglycan/LPS O-acetylase OafA/YrhL
MKIEQVNVTRFMAAMCIVVFHFGRDVPMLNSAPFLFNNSNIGVSFFYVLSGFIMMIAYRRGNVEIAPAEYWKNRIARIYPVYLLGLLAFLMVKHFMLQQQVSEGKNILLNLTALQAWVPGEALSYNNPGWSISVECFFYLIFPFLLNRLYTKGRASIYVPATVALWIGTQVFTEWFLRSSHYKGFPSESHDLVYYLPLIHLNQFLIGNLAGLWFERVQTRSYDMAILGLYGAFLLLLKFCPLYYHNGAMAPVFAGLIVLLAANTGIISRVFRLQPLSYLGEISYGIYILQVPVHMAMWQVCEKRWPQLVQDPTLFFFSYTVVLIVVSAASYELVENPARKAIKRLKVSGSAVV